MSETQSQEYKGNGNHEFEVVLETDVTWVDRLRVPGGWLYRTATRSPLQIHINITFVAMPEVVKHKV